MTQVELVLNGEKRSAEAPEGQSLLDFLRRGCGITSPKDGCQPQGQCGCCTVIIDGKCQVSCAVPASKAAGKTVTTLEGFTDREREIFGRAFVEKAGLQCGFCIPGIVVRAKHLIEKNPKPSRDEIARSMAVHLCRCTGYVKILDAIELAAAVIRGDTQLPEQNGDGRIGTNWSKYEGHELALGMRPYIDDMALPGMLHGSIRWTDHPRALVKRIDVEAARALPGVHAVLLAQDIPGERYQGLIEKDWPQLVAAGEETRCIGDALCSVAADTPEIARAAVKLIQVEYDVRRPLTDPEEALLEAAHAIHPDGNLLATSVLQRGDVEEGRRVSAHVVTESFQTQRIEHLFLEPESSLAVPNAAGGLKVYSPGQGVFDDKRQIASLCALQESNVEVQLVTNGGAFGGKEDLGTQGHASLLALATRRPVKVTLTRDESINFHPKRHPIKMTYSVGCDAEGRLTFMKARMVGDKGAYASVGAKVLERACGHSTGPYKVPHVFVESHAVYTNNPPCGAMRGFGANQAAFAVEQCLDMLAEKVGIDPWEMRWRNVIDVGDTWGAGQIIERSCGLKKTLLAVKEQFLGAKYAGIACGLKNVGIGNGVPETGRARITVEDDGSLTVRTGYTEMGQGLFTTLVQMVAEVTGLDPRVVKRVSADTSRPVDCGMTTASRGAVIGGNAVVAAARNLKASLDKGATLGDLRGQEFHGEYKVDFTTSLEEETDHPITHMTFGYATQVVILDDAGKLKKVIAAHDVGRALNPKICEGQIEGSVHMGLGYALTEDLECEGGVPVTHSLRGIGVLRAQHMPEIEVILVEEQEPLGPFGARGVGEIGLVPTAPAVAGALYAFDKVRRTAIPMKDSPAARAIYPANSPKKS